MKYRKPSIRRIANRMSKRYRPAVRPHGAAKMTDSILGGGENHKCDVASMALSYVELQDLPYLETL